MSSTWASKVPIARRSLSSRPSPTYWRPWYTVSAPATVKLRRREGQRVLVDAAQIEDQLDAGRVGGT